MEEATIKAVNQAQTTNAEQLDALKQAAEHFSLTSNDADLFLIAVRQSFEEGQSRAVLKFLQDPENRDLLNSVGWDLVKIVFQFLPNENTESECKNILVLICDTCNPREICLSLEELLSDWSDSITWPKLVILIGLFQLACERLKGKVDKIFSSVLSSLSRCLTVRENKFDHLSEILEKILEFLKPHIEKIHTLHPACEDTNGLEKELELFLIRLLEFPLVLIDFSVTPQQDVQTIDQDSSDTFRFRKIAETVVEYLGYIECDSFKHLFEYGVNLRKQKERNPGSIDMDSSDEDSSSPSYLGIGCLAFLVLVEGIGSRFLPVVITGKYVLEMTTVYIIPMLTSCQTQIISKGVKLLLVILNMIESATLDHCFLEDGELLNLAGVLTKLMTHCDDAAIRQDAVLGLRRILDRLERRGRYQLLRLLSKGCIHSALAELLILILKDEIAKSLQNVVDDEWFVGSSAVEFLREIFCIPAKVLHTEDGIVEERNRILSSLNLFRFLLIRDHDNKTGVHTIASEVERSYLKPLTDAVTLSKIRLKTLIKGKQDEIKGKRPAEESEVDVLNARTSDGCELAKVSLKDQLQSLEFSNLTIDIIESVLARLREICEEKIKENSG